MIVGEWLSLVEHLVRDQGVGGSNPLSPTILSLAYSAPYTVFARFVFARFFGTFGTITLYNCGRKLKSDAVFRGLLLP